MNYKAVILATLVLFATVALAQNITFNDFNPPGGKVPAKIADGYHNLNWSSFYYVNQNGLGILGNNLPATVGVIGMCGTHCPGTISASTPFHLLGATASGGWGGNTMSVMTMRNGLVIGIYSFKLTKQPLTIDFTKTWTYPVDQVVFTPSGGLIVFSDMTTDTN